MAYSVDLRNKALSYYKQCKNISKVAATFNLSRNTLYWIRLKEQTGNLNHQVKSQNQDSTKVEHYLEQLAQLSDYQQVYLDETGFDIYLLRPYACRLKGQRVKAQISGKKYKRLSLVAAQIGHQLVV